MHPFFLFTFALLTNNLRDVADLADAVTADLIVNGYLPTYFQGYFCGMTKEEAAADVQRLKVKALNMLHRQTLADDRMLASICGEC